MIEFKRREILLIFVMLIFVTTIVFGLGVFLGSEFKLLAEKPVSVADLTLETTEVETVDARTPDALVPVTVPKTVTDASLTEPKAVPVVEEGKITWVAVSAPPAVIPPAPTPKPLDGYTIQVDLLEEEEVAHLEMERIKKLGYPSVFLRKSNIDGHKWYVVDLGYFKARAKAIRFATRLQDRGVINSYIIRKSHDESRD